MKELSIEEKAQAYDEAIVRARKLKENPQSVFNEYSPKEGDTICDYIFPELAAESEDEKMRKVLVELVKCNERSGYTLLNNVSTSSMLAWLQKQGERKPTQEIEPFEAEHGKYYYCIKDYFCGGRKQASKGDVVQALRGLPIMGLKDASEYFLPVNFIKCNHAWGEEDEHRIELLEALCEDKFLESAPNSTMYEEMKITIDWLKSLKPQPKQEWSEKDKDYYDAIIAKLEVTQEDAALTDNQMNFLKSLRPQKCLIPSEEEIEKAAQEWDSKANFNPFYMTMDGDKPTGVKQDITTHKESFKAGLNWILKFLRPQNTWKPSDEQMVVLELASKYERVFTPKQISVLIDLKEQLKKLKGE